jgi:hypothetical protein
VAYVTQKISDLSGIQASDEDFATVTVRQHPDVDKPVQLDVLPKEIETLKHNDKIVMLEVRMPDGETKNVTVTLNEFNKLDPEGKMDEKLAKARGTRGRRPGSTL